jgi:DNA-binding MarR family transcriptional regulator
MSSLCYCTLLRKATRRVAASYDEALKPIGINIAQFSLLRTVQRRQAINLTDLGRLTELDRSTIGRNVRVLERLDLVTSERGADDQREAVVTLSEHGKRVLAEAEQFWSDCQRRVEARLGAEGLDALHNVLRAI